MTSSKDNISTSSLGTTMSLSKPNHPVRFSSFSKNENFTNILAIMIDLNKDIKTNIFRIDREKLAKYNYYATQYY